MALFRNEYIIQDVEKITSVWGEDWSEAAATGNRKKNTINRADTDLNNLFDKAVNN